MSRPAPRKSSLTGSTPLAPLLAADVQPPVAEIPETKPAAATPAKAPESKQPSAAASEKKSYPHKVSFYQDKADTDRVRGAILHTMITEGNRNLSQFIHKAVMAEVDRLEQKYNGGQPFPAVGARELPQGGAAAASEQS